MRHEGYRRVVRALRKASEMGWQPIETAPKDDEPVLVWYPKAFRGKGGCYVALWQDGAWWAAVQAFKFEPTHWMPLPDPPEGT